MLVYLQNMKIHFTHIVTRCKVPDSIFLILVKLVTESDQLSKCHIFTRYIVELQEQVFEGLRTFLCDIKRTGQPIMLFF